MASIQQAHKISIIITTYNRAAYFGSTLESICNQTYSNWELIIIDDGSEEDMEDPVIELQDKRIRFFKAGRIGVTGKLKNIGLEKATGEWIAFTDSDDLWHPQKLEKQVLALQEFPEAGFSLTGGYNFQNPGEPLEYFYKRRESMQCDYIFDALFKSEVSGFIQTLLVRRKCIDETGLFREAKTFSDFDFIINLARHFKAVVLYEPLLYRRIHGSNYSLSKWEKGYTEWAEFIHSYWEKEHLSPSLAKNALFRLYINYGEKCLLYKQKRKAIGCFAKAWKYRPYSIIPLKKIIKAIIRQ